MKWGFVGVGVIVAAIGAYALGVFGRGEVYELPAAEAFSILERTRAPSYVDRMMAAIPRGSVSKTSVPGQEVIWHFMVGDREAGRFTANLVAAGDSRSRVSTHFVMMDDAGKLIPETSGRLLDADSFAQIGRVAMTEQIDSRLDRREFASEKVANALATFVFLNQDKFQRTVMSSVDQAAKASEELDKVDQRLKAQAATERASSSGQVSFEPGKPMVSNKPMTTSTVIIR